jgi:hypothetical protein
MVNGTSFAPSINSDIYFYGNYSAFLLVGWHGKQETEEITVF